ncbi:MAG: energy transducer TonB [Proteobacteria bacterium]|nr:energy transducer TonB [Pseudomonadota bacterium]
MNTNDGGSPVTSEPHAHPPGAAQRLALHLIGRAASHAPAHLAGRLLEEWFADFPLHAGAVAQLRFAAGCCWATSIISREHRLAIPLAAGSASGSGAVGLHLPWQSTPNTRRNLIVVLILLLHGAAIYALATGLVPPMARHATGGLVAHFVDEPQAAPVTPPINPSPFTVPTLNPPIPQPLVPDDTAATIDATPVAPTPQPQSGSGEAPVPAVHRVPGGPGKGFPNTEDYYPPASLRFGETGLAAMQVCVGADGRLSGNPRITESSGSARLDEGALRLARAGSGHYRAATENGRAVSSCFPLRVRFELR